MTEEAGALVVRLEATVAKFERDMARAQRSADRALGGIDNRAARTNERLRNTGSRFGNGLQNRIQQVGFQVGDFAVQVASGQSALRAFIQQGTQVAGAFGPIGAVLGAAGAVVGALATSFVDLGDGADDAAAASGNTSDAIARLSSAMSQAEGNVNGLRDAATEYQAAIRAAGDESLIAANKIIAATRAEFAARKTLLRLDIETGRQELQASRDRQGALSESLTEIESGVSRADAAATRRGALGPDMDSPAVRRARLLQARPESTNSSGLSVAEQHTQIVNTRRELQRLSAEITIGEGQLNRLQDVLSTPIDDLEFTGNESAGGGGGGRAASRGGRGGRGRTRRRAARSDGARLNDGLQNKLASLEREELLLGKVGIARARVEATLDRERMARELLAAMEREGSEITETEIIQAKELAKTIEAKTIAIAAQRVAMDDLEKSERETIARQKEMADYIRQFSQNALNAVASAESLGDALKNVALMLAEIALNAAFGQGPGGALVNELLNVGANGLVGLIGGAASSPVGFSGAGALTIPTAGGAPSFVPHAKGGIINTPTAFPMPNAIGIMGEAGPEAIMPVARMSDGSVGVRSIGGGFNIAPVYNISGLGLSYDQVLALMQRNNRDIVSHVEEAQKRGKA